MIRIGQVLCRALRKARAGSALVCLDGQEHPARSPVEGHKQVAPLGLVLHLRLVLNIHVPVARNVALECLVGLAERLRLEGIGVADAMAAQAPVQPRARDMGN